jgi:hypothetical protein
MLSAAYCAQISSGFTKQVFLCVPQILPKIQGLIFKTITLMFIDTSIFGKQQSFKIFGLCKQKCLPSSSTN